MYKVRAAVKAALFISVLSATSAPTHAADAAGASDSDSGTMELQEVVVTAQKRSQSVLAVPNSVQAITGDQLQDAGIKDIPDLQFTVPGLVPSNGFGYTQMYIRGIGNNIYVGADPSVATYIDDVPRIFGSMVTNFVDVDRVEVLKGAQGGLYGRNATGGVLNIVTTQPSDQFQLIGRAAYGEYNTAEAGAYLNLPINDWIDWNVSVEHDSHDPYVKNVATRNPYTAANFPTGSYLGTSAQTAAFFNSYINPRHDVDNGNFDGGDTKVRMRLSDSFTLTLAGDYSHKDDSSGAGVVNLTPQVIQATAASLFKSYGINAVLQPGLFQTTNQKFATTYGSPDEAVDLSDYGTSATAVLNLPGVDVTSISAYRWQHSYYFADGAYDNPPSVPETVDLHKAYFYQELRAATTGSGPFHVLGGATYLHDRFDGDTTVAYLPPLPAGSPIIVTELINNWTVYAEPSYDITKDLTLTGSIRYIHETNGVNFAEPASSANTVETKSLPSGTLSYKLPDGNVYFRYAQGFKAGGVNPVVPPTVFPSSYGKVFGPENVSTYEVGYRSALLDKSVQVESAIFYNDYKNLQTFTTGNANYPQIIEAIINVKGARTFGADETVQWRALSYLTLGLNFGYLDAKYSNFENTDTSVLNAFNYNGQQMIYAPQWQGGPTATLDYPLNSNLSLIGNVLATYTSKDVLFLSSIPGLPDPTQDAFWLVNMRLGVRNEAQHWELSVFARNLTDKGYYTVGNSSSLGNTFGWGNPRVIGGEIRWHF
jgi:iron complex outermembrane receptor protein